MARFDAFAAIVLVGPRVAALAADLVVRARALDDPAVVIGASPLDDQGAVVRFAGARADRVHGAARAVLAPLAVLLGDDPFANRF
jgi:hypothetical protein